MYCNVKCVCAVYFKYMFLLSSVYTVHLSVNVKTTLYVFIYRCENPNTFNTIYHIYVPIYLQYDTLSFFGSWWRWVEVKADRFCEHVAHAVLVERWALNVLAGLNLSGQRCALLLADRWLVVLLQLLQNLWVISQILFSPHQQNGHIRAVLEHLGVPLQLDVLIGRRAGDAEADDEDVGLRVGEGPQTVVFLLTRRVPQVQTDGSGVYCQLCAVVVEDSRDVFSRKGVGGERNQEAGFPNGTVSDHDTLDVLHCSLSVGLKSLKNTREVNLVCIRVVIIVFWNEIFIEIK